MGLPLLKFHPERLFPGVFDLLRIDGLLFIGPGAGP